MSVIVKSGYLETSPRSLLVRIVYSNGNKSQALATKRQAIEIGENMVGICITEHEWLAIREQIHGSSLPNKDTVLEHMCNKLQGDLEGLKRQIEKFMRLEKRQYNDGEEWKNR